MGEVQTHTACCSHPLLGGQVPAVEKRGAFSRGAVTVPVKTLSTIMHELHHEWVDLLKARAQPYGGCCGQTQRRVLR